jgi:hypothetical protein
VHNVAADGGVAVQVGINAGKHKLATQNLEPHVPQDGLFSASLQQLLSAMRHASGVLGPAALAACRSAAAAFSAALKRGCPSWAGPGAGTRGCLQWRSRCRTPAGPAAGAGGPVGAGLAAGGRCRICSALRCARGCCRG